MKKVICRSIFVLLAVGGFAALAICIQLGVTQGFDEWVYGRVSQTITVFGEPGAFVLCKKGLRNPQQRKNDP